MQTPRAICQDMARLLPNLWDKRVLTLNVEFLPDLLGAAEVVFWADNKAKADFVRQWYPGVEIVTGEIGFGAFRPSKKFDVVVMNPPYQVVSNKLQAKPLYHKFVEKVVDDLRPDLLVAITPSRWMIGGMGLKDFRRRFLADRRIRELVHFAGISEVFSTVSIGGGVSYFLMDAANPGMCKIKSGGSSSERFLDEFDIAVLDNLAYPILKKVLASCENWISDRCSSMNPFGVKTTYKDFGESGTPCHARGKKILNVSAQDFTDLGQILPKWKVCTGALGFGTDTIITPPFLVESGAICTETYIVINAFDSKQEAANFLAYVQTKFFRFMLGIRKLTQDVSKSCFRWVPDLEDYSHPVTDRELYDQFGLDTQERAYIESKIREMK